MAEEIQIRLLELILEEVTLLEKIPVSPERLRAQYLLRTLSLLNLTDGREDGPTSFSIKDLRINLLRKLSCLGKESLFSSPERRSGACLDQQILN